MEDAMAGENRTPDEKIGEVEHAEDQAARTTGHKPPNTTGSRAKGDEPRVYPNRDPAKKKTGEF
jgi:hypothetical protein